MNDRLFRFGGVPVYNPQSLSKEEAKAQFHARQAAYENLMGLLRQERPSHVLIIGTRGMGKTTLLQRVAYGVEDDSELRTRYLVLVFPEEQYNVNRLHHFLRNAVDALADAMEKAGNAKMLARVEEYAASLGRLTPEAVAESVPGFLAEVGVELGKSFLLLVDNADRLFETIEDREQWRLREILSARPDLTFFGATTQASDGVYGPERAFFEFFQIHRLTPLTADEVRGLLIKLSESVEEGDKGNAQIRVSAWLEDRSRLLTLVQLTGGNPRTAVLLFHLVLDGLKGGAREYLEQLLDQCTPGYKGRVDELPAQSQQVLDAVALNWNPVTAVEVAEMAGLDTGTVSSQLTRLARQGLVEKADPGDGKKALYQLAERFFNIWYLMRATRRVRAKLRWFVEFLRVFFDSVELEREAWQRLEWFRKTPHPLAIEVESTFAFVLASGKLDEHLAYLRQTCGDREPEWRPYLDSSRSLQSAANQTDASDFAANQRSLNDAAAVRAALEHEPNNAALWNRLGVLLARDNRSYLEAEAAFRRAIQLAPQSTTGWGNLANVLATLPEHRAEAEAAYLRAIELDPRSAKGWSNFGNLLAMDAARHPDAESAYRKAIELNPGAAVYWHNLGLLLRKDLSRQKDAEDAFRRAVHLEPNDVQSWSNLAGVLLYDPEAKDEAESAFRRAIALDATDSALWAGLADLLSQTSGRGEEAETAYREAINLDPKDPAPWNNLANVLSRGPGRAEEAEAAYRKAIELDDSNAVVWSNLAALLCSYVERRMEAEGAAREATDREPDSPEVWNNLGNVLSLFPDRNSEAVAAYEKAIELGPTLEQPWINLAALSAARGNNDDALAAYTRAVEVNPNNQYAWEYLGNFLVVQLRDPERAESALRKSIELEASQSNLRTLGILLYCELERQQEGLDYLRRAHLIAPDNPGCAAILASGLSDARTSEALLPIFLTPAGEPDFWDDLLGRFRKYPPFGKLLLGICDLVLGHDGENTHARLHRAVALAQVGDFPRASVALDDALVGDPIDLLKIARAALEVFFAAAVRNGRVRDCVELIDKKEWLDAWRPIYEALRAVEYGSGEYLKRVAVEIRRPAAIILRRIAPELPRLPDVD